VSVDVKVSLLLDLVGYSPPEPERLKVGGVAPSPSVEPSHYAGFFGFKSNSREVVVVVEADATKAGDVYSNIQFTGARLKGETRYLGILQSPWACST